MTKMKFGLLLIVLAFASENQENKENKVESTKTEEIFKEKNAEDLILVKIEEDDYAQAQKKTSKFIGVSYNESNIRWFAQRWGKNDKKTISNGNYKDEETAAHASDTLARKLMANGEQNHGLNFPDDDTEVNSKKTKTSKYIGVCYDTSNAKWTTQRWSKKGSQPVHNGSYKDEEAAAYASDTLARKLMANGEQNLKLNFPDDHTEVFPEKTKSSKFVGVSYNKRRKKWYASRTSKKESKMVYNGSYKDEESAAYASDSLARKLMANDDQKLKLNFPDDDTENQKKKRKRSELEENSQNK